jgi:uncharacterized protein YjbJ (UPF0337 family)
MRFRLAPDVLLEFRPAVSRASTFEEKMTNSTRQQIEGDLHDAKGTAKEAEGKLTHDPDLEADGRIEKVAGIVQKNLGKLEKLIGK